YFSFLQMLERDAPHAATVTVGIAARADDKVLWHQCFKYLSNHATIWLIRSAWCLGLMKRWPSPGYTMSWVGTLSAFKACQNSYDCAAGHSASRSPTMMRVGVFTFLMKRIGELFSYMAGSSYTEAPKNGIIH